MKELISNNLTTKDYNTYHCIYWVFTQLCNDKCWHCYNDSGPDGKRMSEEDCLAVVDNLPDNLEILILSGGEPLAEIKKLYAILDKLKIKYGGKLFITLQFNGDLLKPEILDDLIAKGVCRFSVASIDRYHKKQGERMEELAALFESKGIMPSQGKANLDERDEQGNRPLHYGFFGATEDMWLGGNWARGRAMQNDIWKKDGKHNFCAIHSGAIGFLEPPKDGIIQELSIQLWAINPCCPGTYRAMGDARKEKVAEVVQRMASSEIMQKLNKGDIYGVGESIGISAEEGMKRSVELGNVCLWCDEFFKKHFDMATQKAKATEVTDVSFS